ncbi:MAG: hypothetical protein WCE57_11115, partial [Salegentibacter sp.]
MKKLFSIQYFFLLALLLGAGIVTVSCSNDELDDPSLHNVDDELNLSVSDSAFQLQEKFINNQIAFNWSTGTNMG